MKSLVLCKVCTNKYELFHYFFDIWIVLNSYLRNQKLFHTLIIITLRTNTYRSGTFCNQWLVNGIF